MNPVAEVHSFSIALEEKPSSWLLYPLVCLLGRSSQSGMLQEADSYFPSPQEPTPFMAVGEEWFPHPHKSNKTAPLLLPPLLSLRTAAASGLGRQGRVSVAVSLPLGLWEGLKNSKCCKRSKGEAGGRTDVGTKGDSRNMGVKLTWGMVGAELLAEMGQNRCEEWEKNWFEDRGMDRCWGDDRLSIFFRPL